MDLVIRTWEEWCRVFNKADVWRPLVEAICKRHGLPGGEIRPGFEGTNAVFIVGYSLLHRFADMRPWLKELGGAERVRSWEELQQYLWHLPMDPGVLTGDREVETSERAL